MQKVRRWFLLNKFIYNLLDQLKVDFVTEYKIYNYRYDVFIKEKNLIIEMDGGFHYVESNMGRTLEENKRIDKLKDTLANSLGYKVIRIDCRSSKFEYIKNSILLSELPKILKFESENIDWDIIDYNASGNLLINVCSIYNNGITNIDEIALKTHLHSTTVRKYLKKGKKLKLCDYKPINSKRKVRCKTTGEIFNSVTEAANNYGIWTNSIRQSCIGNAHYGGRNKDGKKLEWEYYSMCN